MLPPLLRKAGILALSDLRMYTLSEAAEAVRSVSAAKFVLNSAQRRLLSKFVDTSSADEGEPGPKPPDSQPDQPPSMVQAQLDSFLVANLKSYED